MENGELETFKMGISFGTEGGKRIKPSEIFLIFIVLDQKTLKSESLWLERTNTMKLNSIFAILTLITTEIKT